MPDDDLRLIDRISRVIEFAPPAMARAAIGVAQDPDKIAMMSIAEVCGHTGASKSTIVRLCQALGFDGFRSFKLALAREVERDRLRFPTQEFDSQPEIKDSTLSQIASAFVASIHGSAERIDPKALQHFVQCLREAKRVFVYGVGVSRISADLLAERLVHHGIAVMVPYTGEMARDLARMLTKEDLVIGISYRGLTKDTVAMLEAAQDGIRFAITAQSDSRLARTADHVIEMSVFDAWPKDGSARFLPSMVLLTEILSARLNSIEP